MSSNDVLGPLGSLIRAYYGLSPVFWLVDVIFGANLRALALQDAPGWRLFYYCLCTALGGVMWLRPSTIRWLAIAESSFHLLLLVLGILRPIYRMIDTLTAGGTPAANPITVELLVNFLIAGGVCVTAIYARLPRSGAR